MRCDLCKGQAVVHVTVVRARACAEEKHLCERHGQEFGATVQEPAPAERPPERTAEAAAFDIDLLIVSEITDLQFISLREVDGSRRLFIACGIFEATSLDRAVKRQGAPRPLTYSAWVNTINALGGQVQDVLVSRLHDHTYHARLRVRHGDDSLAEVDVRPSDGLNVAVLCGAPILVADQVLAAGGGSAGAL
jgi:bifunctional DNase/RNase